MLNELIAKHLANGLADFEGLEVTGTVPIKQELINAVIADVLANGLPAADAPSASASDVPSAPGAGGSAKPRLSLDRNALQDLVRQLVKRAEVTAENGALTLHFEVRR